MHSAEGKNEQNAENLLELTTYITDLLSDAVYFCKEASDLQLRQYQQAVAHAVIASVLGELGLSFVVMFPRQSGKNELQAQIETFLLSFLYKRDAEMVIISPTWKPQSYNAMRRLERVLRKNYLTRMYWQKEQGYIYRVGQARIFFLSGSPDTNIVGATASTLLSVDEAQDIQIQKFDKDIAPMAASTNATRVFWGTAWTSRTLLARELRAALAAEKADGVQRVFVAGADDVSIEAPAYGLFVAAQVARLGRSHPTVRTQFFNEEIDAEGGMFPPERTSLMQGEHAPVHEPLPGHVYALLVDVAGEDEWAAGPAASLGAAPESLQNPGRDATALTVVEIDRSTLADDLLKAPTYRVVQRRQWVGIKHVLLYASLRALAEQWRVQNLVIDATGVGAGLASFLERALPGKVLPFIFSAASKSKLGWDFLGIIDSGRWKEYRASGHAGQAAEQAEFFRQLSFCQYEVSSGPGKDLRWGVPDGTRDPANGSLVHDDLVLSAALASVLDRQTWFSIGPALIVPGRDPLDDMDNSF
jgi:hypothetical protein